MNFTSIMLATLNVDPDNHSVIFYSVSFVRCCEKACLRDQLARTIESSGGACWR
jgi:hypothetical protein